MKKILEKAKIQFRQNLPFVIYKKPDDNTIIGYFQKNNNLFSVNDFTEKGFVFASFDGSKTYLIPEDESEIFISNLKNKKVAIFEKEYNSSNKADKIKFENLVIQRVQAIKNNEFKKVVLSRKETVNLDNFDLIDTFEKLVQLYLNTFVYCFFHPKVGIWLGATPEQLL